MILLNLKKNSSVFSKQKKQENRKMQHVMVIQEAEEVVAKDSMAKVELSNGMDRHNHKIPTEKY